MTPGSRVVTVDIRPTPQDVTVAAAERVVAAAAAAIDASGRFAIVLSGGSTPRALYTLLATSDYGARIDWSRVHVFWSDERCLPPDDSASNYRMARETLLDAVPLRPAQVHRIHGEDAPAAAAAAYEREIDALFSDGDSSRFDLVLLGMGDDGHTASLFPGLTAVHETTRRVVAEYVARLAMWRVTLTPPAINAAAAVLFLVTGSGKAPALRQVLEGPREPDRWPAQIVAPDAGHVTWLTDLAGAALLAHR
jgi:6-phosphogluconolactonase